MAKHKRAAARWARDWSYGIPLDEADERQLAQALILARHSVAQYRKERRAATFRIVIGVTLLLLALVTSGFLRLVLLGGALALLVLGVLHLTSAKTKNGQEAASARLKDVQERAEQVPGHAQHIDHMEQWWRRRYKVTLTKGERDLPTGSLRRVRVVDGQVAPADGRGQIGESSSDRVREDRPYDDDLVDIVHDDMRWEAAQEGRRQPERWEVEEDLEHNDAHALWRYNQHRSDRDDD